MGLPRPGEGEEAMTMMTERREDPEDADVVARRIMNDQQRERAARDRDERDIALMRTGQPEDDAEGWQGETYGEELKLGGGAMTQAERDAAITYLEAVGLDATPDAVEQLNLVFRRCLTIMCHRGWDPEGGTWRQAGALGALADCRKKFMRLWERAWRNGARHDDSAIDLINYLGFYLRSDPQSEVRWGEWGEPGEPQ
jgi:hypothetical protein